MLIWFRVRGSRTWFAINQFILSKDRRLLNWGRSTETNSKKSFHLRESLGKFVKKVVWQLCTTAKLKEKLYAPNPTGPPVRTGAGRGVLANASGAVWTCMRACVSLYGWQRMCVSVYLRLGKGTGLKWTPSDATGRGVCPRRSFAERLQVAALRGELDICVHTERTQERLADLTASVSTVGQFN